MQIAKNLLVWVQERGFLRSESQNSLRGVYKNLCKFSNTSCKVKSSEGWGRRREGVANILARKWVGD